MHLLLYIHSRDGYVFISQTTKWSSNEKNRKPHHAHRFFGSYVCIRMSKLGFKRSPRPHFFELLPFLVSKHPNCALTKWGILNSVLPSFLANHHTWVQFPKIKSIHLIQKSIKSKTNQEWMSRHTITSSFAKSAVPTTVRIMGIVAVSRKWHGFWNLDKNAVPFFRVLLWPRFLQFCDYSLQCFCGTIMRHCCMQLSPTWHNYFPKP